jgi:DNA-binding MarR family transcriptional regulator
LPGCALDHSLRIFCSLVTVVSKLGCQNGLPATIRKVVPNSSASLESEATPFTRLMRAGEHEGGLNPAQWEALRYLSRANRFSNSPIALTRFLGSTKGTISQTIEALERKGFITKGPRENEGRWNPRMMLLHQTTRIFGRLRNADRCGRIVACCMM